MLDMYGLAAALRHQARKGQPAWNEDDALWFLPDGPVAKGVALVRALSVRLRRPAAETCEPGAGNAPVSAC